MTGSVYMDAQTAQYVKIALALLLVVWVVRHFNQESFEPIESGPYVPDVVADQTAMATTPPMPTNTDLLPKTVAPADWQTGLVGADLTGANFIDPAKLQGVNTISGAHKNPSWDLRGDVPVNKDVSLSIFNQPSIIGDLPKAPGVFCDGTTSR